MRSVANVRQRAGSGRAAFEEWLSIVECPRRGGERTLCRVAGSSMQCAISFAVCWFSVLATSASASVLNGPARFCGYSPIIDLQSGETISTLEGGIHGGSFEWKGAFGSMVVHGIGWASRPQGRLLIAPSDGTTGRFAERKRDGKYTIAIWNGRQGAAIFESDVRFTQQQRAAIDRVRLFQEGEEPTDCSLRTVFDWNMEE